MSAVLQDQDVAQTTSRDQYADAFAVVRDFMRGEFEAHSDIPPVAITRTQYETGYWNMPDLHRQMIRAAFRHLKQSSQYQMAGAQTRHALLEAARACRKLQVDGKLMPNDDA